MEILNNLSQTFCVLAFVLILYLRLSGNSAKEEPRWLACATMPFVAFTVMLTAVSVIASIWS